MTSGNMGAGLAVACAALGHPLIVTMSAGNSPARARMLESLGAEVVLIPQVTGSQGQVTGEDIEAAAVEARALAGARGAFYVDQFNAHEGVEAHLHGTGPEIWRQTGGEIDAWVAGVGTGATFIGVAKALKARKPEIVCAAMEPEGSEPLSGAGVSKPRHLLQGIGYGSVPPHWDAALVDTVVSVSDGDATAMRRALAEKEGLYVGYSAAANVGAAIRLFEDSRVRPGGTVVTVLCDTGLKY
jgi:cysteine synthase A